MKMILTIAMTLLMTGLTAQAETTTGKDLAPSCAFENEQYRMMSINETVKHKKFKSIYNQDYAMRACEAAGYDLCIPGGTNAEKSVINPLAITNFINPFCYVGACFTDSIKVSESKIVVVGVKLKLKSPKKLKKDLCPQLKICRAGSSDERRAVIEEMLTDLECSEK